MSNLTTIGRPENHVYRAETIRKRSIKPSTTLVRGIRRFITTWPFLLPAVLLFIGWQLYPLLRVAWLSFTNDEALHPDETQWVGLDNYTRAVSLIRWFVKA